MRIQKRYHLPYLPLDPLSFFYSSLMETSKVESFSGFLNNLFFAGRGYSEGFIMDFQDEKRQCSSLKGWSLIKKKFVNLNFFKHLYMSFLRRKLASDLYPLFVSVLKKSVFGLYVHTLSQQICKFLNEHQIILWLDIDYNRIKNIKWESFVFYCNRLPAIWIPVFPVDIEFYREQAHQGISLGSPHLFFYYITLTDGQKFGVGGWFPLHRYQTNCVIYFGVPMVFRELLDDEDENNDGDNGRDENSDEEE